MNPLFIALFGLLLILPCKAFSEITLPKLISNGAIFQRNAPVALWGWADEGEVVTIIVDGVQVGRAQTTNGKWAFDLKGQGAGGPHSIKFEASNKIIVSDVYFGDVWVASGQSNMQLSMARVSERFSDDIAQADFPLLRQFTVPRKLIFDEVKTDFDEGRWERTTPNSVEQHSAAAFYFGRKLHLDENVPIGILSANFGGSPAECWMSEDALKPYKEQYQIAKSYQNSTYLQSLKDSDKTASEAWHNELNRRDLGLHSNPAWHQPKLDDSSWKSLSVPGLWSAQGLPSTAGVVWFRRTIDLPKGSQAMSGLLRLGSIVDADTAYINGVEVGSTGYQYPPRRYAFGKGILKEGENTIAIRVRVDNKKGEFVPEMPYFLKVGDTEVSLEGAWKYKVAGVMPDSPPPLQFVPWNQPLGCYNAMLAPLFGQKIKGVIWYQGESNTGRAKEYETLFPHLIQHWREQWGQGEFPFIFVQLANYMAPSDAPSESEWAELRSAQLKSLRTPNTAMAVAIDVGEWNDLHPLDKKSVGERLALGAQALAYGKKIVYSGPLFKSATLKKQKVYIDFDHIGSGLKADLGALGGFAISGADGKFVWAKAKIQKNKVIVWHPSIPNPKSVRYAWADSPNKANLFNKEGLPASPFEVQL